MKPRERILRSIAFDEVDRPPLLGGWIRSAPQLQMIAGMSAEKFWSDPESGTLRAHTRLRPDGLLDFFVPPSQDVYRKVTHETLRQRGAYQEPEQVKEYVENLPSLDQLTNSFDVDALVRKTVAEIQGMQGKLGETVWMPARWDACCRFAWFGIFGYESYLMFLALYPEHARRLFEYSAEEARLKSVGYARAIRVTNSVPLVLVGEDICGGRGPMVSPDFLREYYFPQVKRSLEPLYEAGIKVVWHSDGNIWPIIDQIIDTGVHGFQGFQEELGFTLADLVKKRTVRGERLLIFGNVSVTETLPFGTPEDVKREIDETIQVVGKRGLFILTSNAIGPEVPIDNILTLFDYPRSL